MVLDVLMGSIWMFSIFCLIRWIMESPNYDFEELVELIIWTGLVLIIIHKLKLWCKPLIDWRSISYSVVNPI